MKKLYKADFTVLFVSDSEKSADLQKEAEQYSKDEWKYSIDCFEITEAETLDEVPPKWLDAIPHGDESFTDGDGTTVKDIIEENLILKLARVK